MKKTRLFFESSFAIDAAGDDIGASHLDNEKHTMSTSLLNEGEFTGVRIE